MKRAVVTGGAGFLGSHVCDRLQDVGYNIVCLDNLITGDTDNISQLIGQAGFHFINHDVTEFINIEGPVDVVLHLASPASPRDYMGLPIETLKVGSLGTHKALGLAKEKRALFLLASTSEVYGDPLTHPQTEDYWGNVNPIGPRSCYDEGKRCAETLFFDYYRQHDLNIKVARIFNTYGPKMSPNDGRVVSNFIVQALNDKPITIYGEGKQTRSFCYVDDLVEAITQLMETEKGFIGPVNLGNPNEFSILELAELVKDITNSNSKLVFKKLPDDDPQQRQPDITLANEKLNWSPKIELRNGLKETIKYFENLILI